jgi:rhodanese-related sulfurtransferase
VTKKQKPVTVICRRGYRVNLPCSDEQQIGKLKLCANDGKTCGILAFVGDDS